MNHQSKYLEEYEKYKDVVREVGVIYQHKNTPKQYKILEINEKDNAALVEVVGSSYTYWRTLHWCRKNLEEL
jgi:fibrillarin-like rRNA methylase